jgi:predicted NBD/HSP70 family sugar kinase
LGENRVYSTEIKKINRNAIYRLLYKHDPISIQEIAFTLKMSLPTVTQNIKELQERDLIIETGQFESTGGRKAKAIAFNNSAKYAVGLDITQNHVGIVLIDLACNLIKNKRIQFPFSNTKTYFKEVGQFVNSFISHCNIETSKVLGVGIALPAILSEDKQKVNYATIINFENGSVRNFSEFIPYTCILSNDANAGGFAEIWGEKDVQDMVLLSLNNTVGGSIIIGKNLYTGRNQRGGEFGHMTIIPNGRTCYCGKKGCVDSYCSAKILSDSTNGNISEFFRLLRENKEPQKTIWEQYAANLAITINNLRMLYDCKVILGGYAGAYMDEHLEYLRELVSNRNTFGNDGSYLDVCKYKLEATAVGAALQHVEAFINSI